VRALAGALATALGVLAGASPAAAQFFFAERPHPELQVGPLIVRGSLGPALGPVAVEVLFSVVIPPTRSAAALAQDFFLVWPGAVTGAPGLGPPDPALAATVARLGFTALEEGRLAFRARNLYAAPGAPALEPVPGGAPFVTFVQADGPLGLTAPATLIRLPWHPRVANRTWLMELAFGARDLIKPKPATWVERTFWGPRYRVSLAFGDVRARAVFPLYFAHRDRVVRLSEDPSQLLLQFAEAGRLRIDELFPPSSGRRLSETLENTEVVSLFLDRAEGLTPQVLTAQFGYYAGLQSWAPALIPILFFALGNLAGPLVRTALRRVGRAVAARIHVGRGGAPAGRAEGVVVDGDALARLVPGESTYADVLRLCGPEAEEHRRLGAPERRTLLYRGRRVVPHRRRSFGWLATVAHWDVEHHELEITLERDVVRDIQARVRRSRLAAPDAG